MTDAPMPAPAAVRSARTLGQRLRLDKYSALYLWAGFILVFGSMHSIYLKTTTISGVFQEKTVVCVLALAFLVPLVTQTFDLSIGANLGLALVILFRLNKAGVPMWLTSIIALGACGLVGFISGFFVVKLKVDSFIATLAMSQVSGAMVLLISNNRQIVEKLPPSFIDIGTKRPLFNLPMYFYFMLILAAILWYVFEHMALGRYMFATGGGREAARLSGVNVDRLTWGSLVASAMISGFAGFVFAWKVQLFQNSAGAGVLFPAVAAVFFGASQLKGRPNVWGALIAVFTLAFGIKGLQLSFDAGTYWIEPLFYGISLLVAVSLAARQGIIKIPKRKAKSALPAAAVG